jgi:hypothetical protein
MKKLFILVLTREDGKSCMQPFHNLLHATILANTVLDDENVSVDGWRYRPNGAAFQPVGAEYETWQNEGNDCLIFCRLLDSKENEDEEYAVDVVEVDAEEKARLNTATAHIFAKMTAELSPSTTSKRLKRVLKRNPKVGR